MRGQRVAIAPIFDFPIIQLRPHNLNSGLITSSTLGRPEKTLRGKRVRASYSQLGPHNLNNSWPLGLITLTHTHTHTHTRLSLSRAEVCLVDEIALALGAEIHLLRVF